MTVHTVVRNNGCPYIVIITGKADACADEGPKHKTRRNVMSLLEKLC